MENNKNDIFDSIAEKLNNQEFDFNPEHWENFEQMVEDKDKRRGGGYIIGLSLLGLFLASSVLIYNAFDDSNAELASSNNNVEATQAISNDNVVDLNADRNTNGTVNAHNNSNAASTLPTNGEKHDLKINSQDGLLMNKTTDETSDTPQEEESMQNSNNDKNTKPAVPKVSKSPFNAVKNTINKLPGAQFIAVNNAGGSATTNAPFNLPGQNGTVNSGTGTGNGTGPAGNGQGNNAPTGTNNTPNTTGNTGNTNLPGTEGEQIVEGLEVKNFSNGKVVSQDPTEETETDVVEDAKSTEDAPQDVIEAVELDKVNPLKKLPVQLTAFIGSNIYKGYENNANINSGNSADPFIALNVNKPLTNRLSVDGSVSYNSKSKLNSTKSYESTEFGFGYERTQTTINTQKLYFVGTQLGMSYKISNKFSANANIGLYKMMETKSHIDVVVENSFGVQSTPSSQKFGYRDGYKAMSYDAAFGFSYGLSDRICLGANYRIGLSDLTRNSFFNNNVADRNTGLQLLLKYNIRTY